MAVKPFFSFSIDYGDGRTVLPQPRSATPEENAARKARDIEAGAQGRADRAAKYAAQHAEKERQKKLARQKASEPPAPGDNSKRAAGRSFGTATANALKICATRHRPAACSQRSSRADKATSMRCREQTRRNGLRTTPT
jgi:hypothetical protein